MLYQSFTFATKACGIDVFRGLLSEAVYQAKRSAADSRDSPITVDAHGFGNPWRFTSGPSLDGQKAVGGDCSDPFSKGVEWECEAAIFEAGPGEIHPEFGADFNGDLVGGWAKGLHVDTRVG